MANTETEIVPRLKFPRFFNKELSLPAVSLLMTLTLFLGTSCLLVNATPHQETITPRRFVDWCLNQASLSPQTKHTIDVLLQETGTQDCNQADNRLSNRLSTLSILALSNNQIADLKPLSSLTKLTSLDLSDNQMLTNKTCPVKPVSICKF